jgi:hypothetical protein
MKRISLAEVIAALANLAPAHREGLLGTDERDERREEARAD